MTTKGLGWGVPNETDEKEPLLAVRERPSRSHKVR